MMNNLNQLSQRKKVENFLWINDFRSFEIHVEEAKLFTRRKKIVHFIFLVTLRGKFFKILKKMFNIDVSHIIVKKSIKVSSRLSLHLGLHWLV